MSVNSWPWQDHCDSSFQGPYITFQGQTRGHAAAFRDGKDRERFRSLLGTIGPEDRWKIHGYSVLRNGYELLIETPAGGLSHGMRSLNGRYTQFFNRRYHREGGLFEGRYKSILVQKEVYLLEMGRHVAWSPVREGLARRPEGWEWSHYRATNGSAKAPAWLETDWTLAPVRQAFHSGPERLPAIRRGGRPGPFAPRRGREAGVPRRPPVPRPGEGTPRDRSGEEEGAAAFPAPRRSDDR